jgi:hypothetical protein
MDLEDAQRDRCWQMLLEDNEAVFHLDADGSVIATVHFNADEVRGFGSWSFGGRRLKCAWHCSGAHDRPTRFLPLCGHVHQPLCLVLELAAYDGHRRHTRLDQPELMHCGPCHGCRGSSMRFTTHALWFVKQSHCGVYLLTACDPIQSYTYEAPIAEDAGDFEPLSAFAYSHITKKFGLESLVSSVRVGSGHLFRFFRELTVVCLAGLSGFDPNSVALSERLLGSRDLRSVPVQSV